MAPTGSLESFAVKSYRYLRWSIVIVVLSVFASLLIERWRAGCFEGSISAYYFTPVHALFVGGLVVIGVSLIAIKGSTDLEDDLLNLAGVLAPIVAFVPTTPPSGCSSIDVNVADTELYIDNNVLAFAIGGALAMGIAVVIGRLMRKPAMSELTRRSVPTLSFGMAILGVGLGWYVLGRQSFLDRAHLTAAFLMFAVVDVVIGSNAARRRNRGKPWHLYAGICAAMPLALVVLGAIRLLDEDWEHFLLWLEVVELLVFGVFWVVQTFEFWDGGVAVGEERATAKEPAAEALSAGTTERSPQRSRPSAG